MSAELVVTVVGGAILGLLVWGAGWARGRHDRRRVYNWLRANTRNEPDESHVDTVKLAKATRLPEERVRRACMSDDRILRAPGDRELWSVWRAEPQSIYEKRGFLSL